jgi:hypothetical protein
MEGLPEQALNSLLTSDRLHPRFAATNLNLARLYGKLAGRTGDSAQKKQYSEAARDRFLEYIDLTYRGRTPHPEVQKELAGYQAQCSGTDQMAAPDRIKAAP